MALPDERALRLNALDNVAVALCDLAATPVTVIGAGETFEVLAREPIQRGHKLALIRMMAGDGVIKYGVTIGYATATIEAGQWVHTHNCRSNLDQRSHTLELQTGAATDTPYV